MAPGARPNPGGFNPLLAEAPRMSTATQITLGTIAVALVLALAVVVNLMGAAA